MSATDEHEIKLEPRYPESRHEDITDAFMRGHLKACETSFKEIKELEAMNKRLRKENDTLCHRIDELCRENEKLMGELADAPKCDACEAMLDCDECLRADGSHKERRRLSAENAELRELVADMMQAWWACDDEVCPRHDERCEKGKYCAFDECAQELGIEVGA